MTKNEDHKIQNSDYWEILGIGISKNQKMFRYQYDLRPKSIRSIYYLFQVGASIVKLFWMLGALNNKRNLEITIITKVIGAYKED